ncbi:MAG: biotin--[acetyl-CoA-carboxylase] ligase [Sideroxydans sp.]|nr:biotin--[acetyl-CoA-carboxylase] ligase [Sideroxydans sp.]
MKTLPARDSAAPAPRHMTFAVLRLLADGDFHSGEGLARQLGVSRASVNNALRGIDAYGLTLHSVRGRGYRLVNSPQWLDAKLVAGHLGKQAGEFRLEIIDSATSSNTLLLQRARQEAEPSGSVLAVEWQSGGRGRLGRPWHAGLGNALTFSLLWRFECCLSGLSGLSLAVGVALVRALDQLGIKGAQLKWPNDVVTRQGKLAGILLEAQGDMLGPSAVVIGIGINLSLPPAVAGQIDQPVSSLAEMSDVPPDRNRLLAILLRELGGVLHGFATTGFAALRAEWEAHHRLQNQPAHLSLPDGKTIAGIVRGVTDGGALRLETPQGMQTFDAGEVSLRPGAVHAAD